MTRIAPAAARGGTVLIIVAGLSALLAALALAFLARMRSDVEESRFVLMHAQAKIMLAAGCNYIQETARIGWDRTRNPLPPDPPIPVVDGFPIHEESFGWVDVRDGRMGPRNRDGQNLADTTSGQWPALGSHVRCPMHVRKVPPYATRMDPGFNPMVTGNPTDPNYAYPLLRYPDPQPLDNLNRYATNAPEAVSNASYGEFASGDPTPQPHTLGKAWFRVFRDGPGTFLITCGAGGTYGYKDWEEMPASDRGIFGSKEFFLMIKNAEVRLHYRVEWSAAGIETSFQNLQHEIGRTHDHYETWPPNSSHSWSSGSRRTQTWLKTPVGTIRWIQRLATEPKFW